MTGRRRQRRTLADWLAAIERLHPKTIELGLERLREVAARLSLSLPCTVITVGGTNGKGSTCAMLESILLAAGYRVALYTSPHLVRFNERARIDGTPVDDAALVGQFEAVEAARGNVALTYFEFTTLAMLRLFQQRAPDVAILEVGLGGRLDAVNLVDADCAIVTSIDVDHAEYLGDTRERIGWEKAHIFRAGRPAICSDPLPPATLVEHARSIGADLWLHGRDFRYTGDRQQWSYGGRAQRRNSLALSGAARREPVAQCLGRAGGARGAARSAAGCATSGAAGFRGGRVAGALPGVARAAGGRARRRAHNPHAAAHLAATSTTWASSR